ncbi:MAG: hypothetical protein WC676_04520 [Candidatus Omnitrophota bacterium]
MSPAKHVIASGVTSVVFMVLFKSWAGAVACFLSGILIDVDHLWDFYLGTKKISFSVQELDDFCSRDEKGGKLYLFFHSYEFLAVLWGIVFYSQFSPVLTGIVLGMSVHLLLDQITNAVYPWAYFFFYRARFGFPQEVFFKERFLKRFVCANETSYEK